MAKKYTPAIRVGSPTIAQNQMFSERRKPAIAPAPSGRTRRRQIALLIADQEARIQVNRPAFQQIPDHAGSGFAPVADPAISSDAPLRVERAIADVVDMPADRGKLRG